YWAVVHQKQAILEKATESVNWLIKAAEVLQGSPAEWRFWTEKDGYRNCDSASASSFIDYTDWPSIGYLVSLHLQFLDADRRLLAAYEELTAPERVEVSKLTQPNGL